MLNPDGVIMGNYRTGLAGFDLNRQFNETSDFVPTVKSLMKLSANLHVEHRDQFILYLDLHGHSVKRNVFAYGPEFPITEVLIFYFFKLSRIILPAGFYPKYFPLIARLLDITSADSQIQLEKNVLGEILWLLLVIWSIHLQ